MKAIDKLILHSPYEEPTSHWEYNRVNGEWNVIEGRRPAGFVTATIDSKLMDDPGVFHQIPHINEVRKKINKWRDDDYPGITNITRELLKFWKSGEYRLRPFFFCQIEAIETIIWFTECGESDHITRKIRENGDGGEFLRLCSKMATSTGKTVVMAMLITWHVANKFANPNDGRFTRNFLIVAPNKTVAKRLGVLCQDSSGNYYEKFKIVPKSFRSGISRTRIKIVNWQAMSSASNQYTKNLSSAEKRVLKKGPISDDVFAKRLLGHNGENILIVNDEAHHAWRIKTDEKIDQKLKDEIEMATKWIEGLDRIHHSRRILCCHDFSATPFIPKGKQARSEELFTWIISDFGLSDAIESGITKTPRTPKQDNSGRFDKEEQARMYRFWNDEDVRIDLQSSARSRDRPLPALVSNAYDLLASDWQEVSDEWMMEGNDKSKNDKKLFKNRTGIISPVMITVCNHIRTAERVESHFKDNSSRYGELSKEDKMFLYNSKEIDRVEDEDLMRRKADTVGEVGEPGEHITNVISVSMLNEGWDAHNVTHIMGLRPFQSQLLCEQVVGRGLRRVSYETDPNGHLKQEHVNIFGIPFAFLPHEESDKDDSKPLKPQKPIFPVPKKSMHAIAWPNGHVSCTYAIKLAGDWREIPALELNQNGIITKVLLSPNIGGQSISLDEHMIKIKTRRIQTDIFRAAKAAYEELGKKFIENNKEICADGSATYLAQLIRAISSFIMSGKITISGVSEDERWQIIRSNLAVLSTHVAQYFQRKNVESKYLELDKYSRILSTADMDERYTRKNTQGDLKKCHMNVAIWDSKLEKSVFQDFEINDHVTSWVKNDRYLGFRIEYLYAGKPKNYIPDFLVRLDNGITLVLETKGRKESEFNAKKMALEEWVEVVNNDGRYGPWACHVGFDLPQIRDIVNEYASKQIKANISTKCPICRQRSESEQISVKFGFCNNGGISKPEMLCIQCRNIDQN